MTVLSKELEFTSFEKPYFPKPVPTEWQHNWLYSVVPVSVKTSAYRERNYPPNSPGYASMPVSSLEVDYPLAAYLTGYCRNCRKAFSAPIPSGDKYVETQMEIPVFGCVGP